MSLLEMLKDAGAIKFGDFVLSSGKRSRVYIDVKQAITKPEVLEAIASQMAEKLRNVEFDRIACIELGGVPIAVALSLKTGKELVIFRKKRKEYGTGDDRIGEIRKGERVVVVEDVITTGKSARSVIERVEELGGEVKAVIAVVDREESDLEVISLLKLSEILKNT
ncbi:orotate phosphoribosyltransferase [Geoglobus ahangari]|uniref:Orotate phosphoribosyltransferase n=1 Tax=Geoglobus ahangari TaxID=113653 RepID=A0A0F7IEG9_9EURY|nr:orotate phosphoribosyltransferase [Geoglobus ahangari]AKG91933.1 orotate phosphoribosyltransferase [Geoglobus ahangari]